MSVPDSERLQHGNTVFFVTEARGFSSEQPVRRRLAAGTITRVLPRSGTVGLGIRAIGTGEEPPSEIAGLNPDSVFTPFEASQLIAEHCQGEFALYAGLEVAQTTGSSTNQQLAHLFQDVLIARAAARSPYLSGNFEV